MAPHGNIQRNHLIKADIHRLRCKGLGSRYWYFTFSEAWGPLLTDEWGEPVGQAPLADETHPFWDSFEAWQRKCATPSRALSRGEG